MAIETEIKRYYDLHPTEEDLMGDTRLQATGTDRIADALEWQYRHEDWYVARNLNIYVTTDPNEPPIEPDVALFKGVNTSQLPDNLPSWTVGPTNPYTGGKTIAPTVVFEIASERTWKNDRDDKPGKYARMGVKEYYWLAARDAEVPRRVKAVPLWGWRGVNGRPEPMQPDARSWIWSRELESWVAAEGNLLQLYDRDGNIRPTGEEAERAAKERAWAKLRELGIDPETLENPDVKP